MSYDEHRNKSSCIIHGAKQIVQIVSNKQSYLRGGCDGIKSLAILYENSERGPLNIVSIDGIIRFVGYENDDEFNEFRNFNFDKKINATGCSIIPGFVDSHTHPIWDGDRVHEFQMKLEGATYMEIHAKGGGIHYTVDHTSQAKDEDLLKVLQQRLRNALKCGTTTIECKSGYGLDWPNEYKLLRLLTECRRNTNNVFKPDMQITYLGAHAVPKNKTASDATKEIILNQIPNIKRLIDSNELDVDNIDVFCEKGVFDVDQSRNILLEGKKIGLNINFHGDELFPFNSVMMGVEIGSKAVSHLEEINDDEIEALGKSETVGILLPTTAYILRLKQPPARKMLDKGCIAALASDFNPNAYCYSMPLVMHLACINMKMTLNEALVASTLNSAFALGVSKSKGSIECGKHADLVVIKADRWEHLVYQMGCQDTLIKFVILRGNIVHSTI